MDTPVTDEINVTSRVDAAIELYSFVMKRVKHQLEAEFTKPTYYSADDKVAVVSATCAVYSAVVTPQLIEQLQSRETTPDVIVDLNIPSPPENTGEDVWGWEGEA